MPKQFKLSIKINRNPPPPVVLPFVDCFKGFEKVRAVRDVFGEKTGEVLEKLKVRLIANKHMYMGVSDDDASLAVGLYHLKHGDFRTLYLDVVHELFHVKQFMVDQNNFRKEHQKYLKKTGFDTSVYYRSPIEIPAYKHAVEEAKRIGMTYDEIADYLKIGETNPKVFSKFLKAVELERGLSPGNEVKLSVRINRKVSVPLFSFTAFFQGFEKVATVRELFGERTEEVLNNIKIAFHPTPYGFISLNEEDHYLEVSTPYLKKGDSKLLYMDVILCMNLLKRSVGGAASFDIIHRDFAENPVLLQSYQSSVDEAKRIGLSNDKILEHLRFLNFVMAPASYRRFVRSLGLGSKKEVAAS